MAGPRRVTVNGVVGGLRVKPDLLGRVVEVKLSFRIFSEEEAMGVIGADVLLPPFVGAPVCVSLESLQGSFAAEPGADGPEFRTVQRGG